MAGAGEESGEACTAANLLSSFGAGRRLSLSPDGRGFPGRSPLCLAFSRCHRLSEVVTGLEALRERREGEDDSWHDFQGTAMCITEASCELTNLASRL